MGSGRRWWFQVADGGAGHRALRRLPGGEALAWRGARRYVAGRTRAEALALSAGLLGGGHTVSLDLVGERVTDPAEADAVTQEYVALAGTLPALTRPTGRGQSAWLSADLTHLGLDVDPDRAAGHVTEIVEALPPGARLQVGAEDSARTDATLDLLRKLRHHADRLGATLQANLMRSPTDLEDLADLGVHVRLVKGAYAEPTGTYDYGERTDLAFLRLAHRLAERRIPWSMATHDARLRDAILMHLGTVEVEQLLGIHPQYLGALQARAVPTRVYVPFGPGWLPYWLRRVAESQGA